MYATARARASPRLDASRCTCMVTPNSNPPHTKGIRRRPRSPCQATRYVGTARRQATVMFSHTVRKEGTSITMARVLVHRTRRSSRRQGPAKYHSVITSMVKSA